MCDCLHYSFSARFLLSICGYHRDQDNRLWLHQRSWWSKVHLELGTWLSWQNACLTCTEPWIWSPSPHKLCDMAYLPSQPFRKEFRRRIQTRTGQHSRLKASLRHRKPCQKTQCVWSEYSHALFNNEGVFWGSHPPVVFTSCEQRRTFFENQVTWHSLFLHPARMCGQQEMCEAAVWYTFHSIPVLNT